MRTAIGLAAIVLSVAVGCKEGSEISTAGLQPAAAFAPETRPPSVTEQYVSLRESRADGGRIVLDVVVSDVPDVIQGIALRMTYPDGFSNFLGCEDGDLFPVARAPLCEQSTPGELLISRNAIGAEPGAAVVGDRVILRLEFLVFGVTEGPLTFEAQNLGGGSALQDAVGDPIRVDWFAGRLRGE